MTSNKKPVLIVAVVLGGLIIIPLILLIVSKSGGSGGEALDVADSGSIKKTGDLADYDLRQLAEKAESLIEGELEEALRNGDVSLDFVSALKKDAEKAKSDLNRGRLERATEGYSRVVQAAEAQLEALAMADKARALSDSTYAELQRLEYLKPAFENTYREAVETYNSALKALNSADYQTAVDDFEMSGAILGDLDARVIQQIAGLLEAGKISLQSYELSAARTAFESVLELDSANSEATDGLTMVSALEGIAEEVKAIRALEERGELEAALAELDRLAAENPQNPFIRNQRATLEARIIERDFNLLVAKSIVEEKAEEFGAAVATLEEALKLKASAEQANRLAELKKKYKAARLEILLADGYDALKAGRYEAARNLYKEAVALAPDSSEARTGLEKASSLYLANIRYSQNIAAADKQIKEGRYPLAAKLFNSAMASRPTNVVGTPLANENRIRKIIEAQSTEVSVSIESDKRTYVSIIGVLPPDRFKEEELKLFPDVYKVRGTRKGYEDVKIDLKVDATKGNMTITVECTEKL